MYTNLENVQIIISLLKQHGIKRLVLSPGNRDIPLVHSVETDGDFECYSIVDERSAAYFALGLSQATNEPVGFVCTSSTASCNFMPAIEEASRKSGKLIALTADRENYYLYQFEDQKINQTDMYYPYTKYSADLPVVRNELDKWLCIRKVNEALLELQSDAPGSVQINFQVNRTDLFPVKHLPKYRKIENIAESQFIDNVSFYQTYLSDKKIMVLVGEYYYGDKELSKHLEVFQAKYNAIVISDHFSNCEGNFLASSLSLETMTAEDFVKYTPDLVITVGGHIWSAIKYRLRNSKVSFEHWRISTDGVVRDGFKRLTNIYSFDAEYFFAHMNQKEDAENTYSILWTKKANSIVFPDLKFSNFSAIRDVMKRIPENSVVHCSILNSARLNSFSDYTAENIKTYCNFGCDGIDGCMSSFLGQTANNDAMSFLVIGDLSFLYDLNVTFEHFDSGKRILLINNHAGSEFYTAFGLKRFPTLNKHMAAGHNNNIYDSIDTDKFIYLSASSQQELDKQINIFVGKSDKPILLEVFTDACLDGEVLNAFYALNNRFPFKSKIEHSVKKLAKKILRM